ncbi:MAG TPA: NADH-quinone oxidoreductase subunit J [Gemmatales bacterium]|nr:NADH-quinone oxidoreductase subunit J [Gemmatales bacterium]
MSKFFSWLVTYWYLVLPLITGFVAIVTLLPHPGKGAQGKIKAGLAAGVLTILLIGLLLMRSSGYVSVDLFFDAFAIVTIASAAAVIVQCNPVYSALYFAITVLGVCGLFLIKSASFLAAATIIVYAGAIIVTFLFVIMLAQQTGLADYDRRSRERIFSCLAGFVLLAAILFIIEKNFAVKDDPTLVVSTLKEAQSLTAPGRYPRTGVEILETLQVKGKPTEMVMMQQFDALSAWPEAEATRVQASKSWTEARTHLQANQAPRAHSALSALYAIADRMEDAHNRFSSVLSISTTPSLFHNRLSEKRQGTDHVNELGRSLFGDYLYAVELAGTLLLVATIAAILIAQEPVRKKVAA